MIEAREKVVLTRDLPDEDLVNGDSGTVIHVYGGGKGYEVEFFSLGGSTLATATVRAEDIRVVSQEDITHARPRTHT